MTEGRTFKGAGIWKPYSVNNMKVAEMGCSLGIWG